MSEHIVDINTDNAQALLIEESFKRPVMVDFWADWCGPCKSLMPVLEKLAGEYNGQFLLAKVNADEQQMIAGQFGVRSLPTVMIMKDGQPVDGFAGAQTEQQVRELLGKYLPKPWEEALGKAQNLMDEENYSEAVSVLKPAYEESGGETAVAFALAQAYVGVNRLDEAEALLDKMKILDQQDPAYEHLRAQIKLAREAGKSPEIEILEKKLADSPGDGELALQLALQYSQNNFHKEALETLYGLIRRDLNFRDGEAKKAYVDILAVLGKGDPLAAEYQRKLYTLLY